MSKLEDKPKLDDRSILRIKGQEFVRYWGLLSISHQIGLQSIKVETIQFPKKENGMEAICQAHVVSKNGEEFVEIADANPNNVAPLVKQHILRMAATRAKARALRDFTNIGITCLEELGNIDDLENDNENRTSKPRQPKTSQASTGTGDAKAESSGDQKKTETAQAKKKENPEKDSSDSNASNGPKMSTAQKKAILNLAKRRGLSEDDLTKLSIETFNVNFEYLDSSSASVFIRDLQHAA